MRKNCVKCRIQNLGCVLAKVLAFLAGLLRRQIGLVAERKNKTEKEEHEHVYDLMMVEYNTNKIKTIKILFHNIVSAIFAAIIVRFKHFYG